MRGLPARRPRCTKHLAVFTTLLISALVLIPTRTTQARPYNPLPSQPGFANGLVLPGAVVEYSSPTVADLDKDATQEIVIGGIDGKLYAIRSDGTTMWTFDVASSINAVAPRAGKARIDSAAAIGDLDNDSWLEVVVSADSAGSGVEYNGAVVVLSYDGKVRAGWPQVGVDQIGPNMGGPDGWLEGFYSSPSLADLDGDGDLEIVVGGWDMRYYAWHHNGQLVRGWPRFAADTVWSSPATGDLDGDGRDEVVIGRDSGSGGVLDVLRGDGSRQPGFPKQIDQTIGSSPALADLNGDGRLDIVTGTGSFYGGMGMAVYAWDGSGNPLPGWPAATESYPVSSPSVGDLDGDGDPEVVVGANDGKVYAFHGNGQPVQGWPAVAYDNSGHQGPLQRASPVLANFDSDPQPEVFINSFCDTVVIDGNGSLLTHVGNSGSSGKPSMLMPDSWCFGTTPAVSDLDKDGRLEVVRAGGVYNPVTKVSSNALIYAWEVSSVAASAPWPMYRGDPEHHALYRAKRALDARVISRTLPDLLAHGESRRVAVTMENTGSQTWTNAAGIHLQAAGDNSLTPGQRVSLGSSESIAPGQRKTFEFDIQADGRDGYAMSSWRMSDGAGHLFGPSAWRQIKIGSDVAYYVLSRFANGSQGGVSPGGLASQLSPPKDYWNWPAVRDVVVTSDRQGYEMLDDGGCVWQGGTAPALAGYGCVPDAVELLMRDDSSSYYYVLDRYGRLQGAMGAPEITPAPPLQGGPSVRSGALTADGKGVYLLLRDGAILSGGNAPALAGAPNLGADLGKKIHLAPHGAGAYVLDAYGRVWPVGGAPAISPNYEIHMNQDWARDLELTEDGRGFYMLDREGGIHTGGVAPAPDVNPAPTWPGQDAAVALVVTDSRAISSLETSPTVISVLTTAGLPRSIHVSVRTSDQGGVNWRATSSAGWIKIQIASGATPGTLAVNVDPSGMGLGTYSATIQIENPEGIYPGFVLPVQLKVVSKLYKRTLPLIMR